ncbi:hypothetical protein RR46_12872 [Papilio xuthus]|uniref:Uncharacterized protein n=1 Tax=Papilio xuthus TaxID=66420 RepID=A0A194PK60_PAPXU|nr:hypothetical protein RR46_12872 [Papilio xuthus]
MHPPYWSSLVKSSSQTLIGVLMRMGEDRKTKAEYPRSAGPDTSGDMPWLDWRLWRSLVSEARPTLGHWTGKDLRRKYRVARNVESSTNLIAGQPVRPDIWVEMPDTLDRSVTGLRNVKCRIPGHFILAG